VKPSNLTESRLSPQGRKRRIARRAVALLDVALDAVRVGHPVPSWLDEQIVLAGQRLAEALASQPGDPA
jgi:hypothetical protein